MVVQDWGRGTEGLKDQNSLFKTPGKSAEKVQKQDPDLPGPAHAVTIIVSLNVLGWTGP